MRSFKKKIALLVCVVLLAGLFGGCGGGGGGSADEQDVYIMRIGNVTAPDHVLNVTFEEMAERINERSGGRIQATVYPSGQLGTLRTMTEGLQTGVLEMTTQSAGGLGSFLPIMGVLELPYMYNSHQHVYDVVDGEIGDELNQKFLDETGIRIIGYWMNLYRHTTNNVRPIVTVDDFSGLNIRVPETKTVMDTIDSLGANAVPMAVNDLYTSMSQGAVDGQENPFSVIYASKYYEVQEYLSLTGHIYSPTLVMISEDFYQSLPDDLRQIVDEEVAAATITGRAAAEQEEADLLAELRNTMQVNEVEDLDEFRAAVQPVYDGMIAELGDEAKDYIDRIVAMG